MHLFFTADVDTTDPDIVVQQGLQVKPPVHRTHNYTKRTSLEFNNTNTGNISVPIIY
jgi:hypothetical protein